MGSVNEVTLVGRLGTDVEFRVYGDGTTGVSKFRMATDKWGQDGADWHSVSAFGKSGLFARDHLGKGDLVCVRGRIEYSQKGDKWYTDIVASRVTALHTKNREAEPDPPSQAEPVTERDDEVPF